MICKNCGHMIDKKDLSAEFARIGGSANGPTKDRGPEHYRRISRLGNAAKHKKALAARITLTLKNPRGSLTEATITNYGGAKGEIVLRVANSNPAANPLVVRTFKTFDEAKADFAKSFLPEVNIWEEKKGSDENPAAV